MTRNVISFINRVEWAVLHTDVTVDAIVRDQARSNPYADGIDRAAHEASAAPGAKLRVYKHAHLFCSQALWFAAGTYVPDGFMHTHDHPLAAEPPVWHVSVAYRI